jgi:hypothetical protein
VQGLVLTDVTVGIPSGPTVNEVAALGDTAVHQSGYFGDTNNSGGYSGADVTLMQRVVANLASGFANYANTDPLIVGDINGSGTFSGADTSLLQARVANQVVPQIPPITAALVAESTVASTPTRSEGVTNDLRSDNGDDRVFATLFSDSRIK